MKTAIDYITGAELKNIFAHSYGIVIEGYLYDIMCNYEDEDGTIYPFALCDTSDYGCGYSYVIREEWLNENIAFNSTWYTFNIEAANGEIPPFKVLQVVKKVI